MEPVNVKVCGHVVLNEGETNADTFVTLNAGAGVVGTGTVGVNVDVLAGIWRKPKLKPFTVPQPKRFTDKVVEPVGVQPAGFCATTR